MTRFSQYELWVPSAERWQMIASFREFDVAYAVARGHGTRVRLMQVTYDSGKPVEQEMIADFGTMRDEP